MKKIISTILILSASTLANAVPNIWTEILRQGGYNVQVSTQNNDELDVGCFIGSDGAEWQNLTVTYKRKEITNTPKSQPLSFLINDNLQFRPVPVSNTSRDDYHWNSFLENLVKARKIEVYNSNKLLFVLKPRNGNYIQDITNCNF